MTRLLFLLLTLFVSLNSPAMERNADFWHSPLAAKAGANAFDRVASHELSVLTSKGAKDWVKGVSDVVPPKDDLLRLQEIARRLWKLESNLSTTQFRANVSRRLGRH